MLDLREEVYGCAFCVQHCLRLLSDIYDILDRNVDT